MYTITAKKRDQERFGGTEGGQRAIKVGTEGRNIRERTKKGRSSGGNVYFMHEALTQIRRFRRAQEGGVRGFESRRKVLQSINHVRLAGDQATFPTLRHHVPE